MIESNNVVLFPQDRVQNLDQAIKMGDNIERGKEVFIEDYIDQMVRGDIYNTVEVLLATVMDNDEWITDEVAEAMKEDYIVIHHAIKSMVYRAINKEHPFHEIFTVMEKEPQEKVEEEII